MADVEVVIKIPEEKYDRLIKQMQLDRNFSACKISLLPKGHGRLGDLDELMNRIGLEDNADNREENVGEIVTLEDIDSVVIISKADKKEKE